MTIRFLLALTVGLAGCATNGSDDATAGGLSRVEAVQARDLWALEAKQVRFERTVEGQAREVTFEMSNDQEGWSWSAPDLRTVRLLPDDQGGIFIVREIEPGEDSDVRYEPALLMLPARLDPDQPVHAESRMTVFNDKGNATRARGACRVAVELLGWREVDTPAGRFDAVVIRTTRHIQLDLATAQVVIHAAYAPGVGLVTQSMERRTRALGLFEQTAREDLRRLP